MHTPLVRNVSFYQELMLHVLECNDVHRISCFWGLSRCTIVDGTARAAAAVRSPKASLRVRLPVIGQGRARPLSAASPSGLGLGVQSPSTARPNQSYLPNRGCNSCLRRLAFPPWDTTEAWNYSNIQDFILKTESHPHLTSFSDFPRSEGKEIDTVGRFSVDQSTLDWLLLITWTFFAILNMSDPSRRENSGTERSGPDSDSKFRYSVSLPC